MLAEGGMMRGLFNITSDGKKLRNYVCNKPKEYDYAVANSDYVKYISRYCQPYEENRLDVANDVLRLREWGCPALSYTTTTGRWSCSRRLISILKMAGL